MDLNNWLITLECGWRHTGNVQGGVLANVQEWGCFSIFRRADDVTQTMSKGGCLWNVFTPPFRKSCIRACYLCKISGKSTPLPPPPNQSVPMRLWIQESESLPLITTRWQHRQAGRSSPKGYYGKPEGNFNFHFHFHFDFIMWLRLRHLREWPRASDIFLARMRTIIKGEFWRDCRLCADGFKYQY